ncbi:MAG: hypothetical protein ACQEUZ_04370 [Pseudomonadota bacterium]
MSNVVPLPVDMHAVADPPEPCPEMAAEHVRRIAEAAREGSQVELALISADGSGSLRAKHFGATEAPERAAMLVRNAGRSRKHHWNAYVGAAPRSSEAPPENRAKAEHALATRWLWLDFDDAESAENGPQRLAEAGLAPTLLVRTGTHPALRRQVWVRLSEPVEPREAAGRMKALAAALGADPAPCQPAALMRLAGSVSWPKANKPGRVPELVTLEEWPA